MIRLIKWQLRPYRTLYFQRMALLFLGAAVVAWFSYSLFAVPIDLVVTALNLVQVGFLGWGITIHYADMVVSEGTLTLHVPLPGWWILLARLVGILPILIGYIAVNSVLFLALPPDLQQVADISLARTFFRAASAIYWIGAIMNALIVRTRLHALSSSLGGMRFLNRFAKLRDGLYSARSYLADIVLLIPYAILAGVFQAQPAILGFTVPLQALIVVTVGVLLTVANGYLLEHYTPQVGPLF